HPAAPRSPRRDSDSQQSLDFHSDRANLTSSLGTEVHAVIYCDAPVALPAHRMIAAAFDASMVLIAVGLFLGVFFLSGGLGLVWALVDEENLTWHDHISKTFPTPG